jgi:hypothetical protein
MVSHVEMGLAAAGGFKLFGKVITQCAPPAAAASRGTASLVARERDDPDERDQPVVKREAAASDILVVVDKHRRSGSGGGPAPGPATAESEDSKGQHHPHPRPRQPQQQQDTAEARAAASAPPLPCPRCRSRNTKFCYFNNYNVNQPRHFCKDCHRYWTAGGALRNVPVGAGRRKNRPLGAAPIPVAVSVAAHHHQHLQHPAAAAGLVLPGQHPSCPTSPSPAYAGRWPVCPDRRF